MAFTFLGRISRQTLRAVTLAAVVLVALVAPVDHARSDGSESVILKFDVYSRGLRIATLKFTIGLTNDVFTIAGKLKTKGLVALFASSSFDAVAEGQLTASALDPTTFRLETDSRKGERNVVITWDGSDAPVVERDYDYSQYRIDDLANHNAPGISDPLTGLLSASLAQPGELCANDYRVHDGRTIYDFDYEHIKRDDFVDGDAGIYRGEAYQCRLTYRPIAGLSNNRQAELAEANLTGEEIYTVWMAPIHSTVLGRTVFIPVGAVGTYDGGDVYIYLKDAALNGQPLS